MKRLEIAIAGCGVAGLAAAALLRRQGARVVVYDRLSTPRPVGSGLILQPVGLHVLDAMGAGEAMRALGAPIHRLYGKSGARIVLDVRYAARGAGRPVGLSVHRGALFHVLYEAAREAGAEFETDREIAGVGQGRLAFAGGGESPRFDLIVDALGARSPLARRPAAPLKFGALWASLAWAGEFDPHALEQRYEAARKMVGVLPVGRLPASAGAQAAFFWSLMHAELESWRGRSIEAWKAEVLELWPETAPLLAQIGAHDDVVFAAYAHRTLRDPVTRDCVHIGDSWHSTSPQLGQGANMALLDACALAEALSRQDDLGLALHEYARMRLWHVRLYQGASFLFTPAYQSDQAAFAWLRDFVMSPLARIPPMPALLAMLVAGELGAPLSALR